MTKSLEPESLLSAARKLADAANLPWAHVQKFYQALQDGGVLPKSKGRSVVSARPELIGLLIIALASTDEPAAAVGMANTFRFSSENGSGFGHLDDLMASALVSEANAADVLFVDIFSDTLRVRVKTASRGDVLFWTEAEEVQEDGTVIDVARRPKPMIRFNGGVDGELFQILAKTVNWEGSK